MQSPFFFSAENCQFLKMKNLCILHGHVFVMDLSLFVHVCALHHTCDEFEKGIREIFPPFQGDF